MKKKLTKILVLAVLCLFVFGSVASAKSPAAASIGGKKYSSLEKALKAVKSGQTIKLRKDVTMKKTISVKRNVKFTLDLNKRTIKGDGTYGDPSTVKGALWIRKGQVTIRNGKVKDGAIRVEKNAKLTIQSGNYEQLINYGTIVVNKATITQKVGSAIYNYESGRLTINNVTAKAMKNVLLQYSGTVVIRKGTFQPLDTKDIYPTVFMGKGDLKIEGGSFHAENCAALAIEGGKATVTGGSFTNNSAGKVTAYTLPGADLTIKGGTFSAKQNTNLLVAEGNVNVEGGTFTSDWPQAMMYVRNGGKLTVAGKVEFKGNSGRIYNESGSVTQNGKTDTFTGMY